MGASRIIVTDIDGTLTGDDDALDRFIHWYRRWRGEYRLVYATGRSIGSLRQLVADRRLPAPDAAAVSVGTELYDRLDRPWPGWADRFDGWDADRVRSVLGRFRWLVPQPSAAQSRLKASYDAPDLQPAQLAVIRHTLAEWMIDATVVYSSAIHLDVLAPGSGKGRAAAVIATAWEATRDNVLAFGDSGNDLQLFQQGFRGTVVANVLPELVAALGRSTYRSPCAFADGVLDGINYWSMR